MGCGCGKNRQSRSSRLNSQRIKQVRARNRRLILAKKQKQVNSSTVLSHINQKAIICSRCEQSAQTSKEKQKGLKIWQKTNRLISNLIRDARFKCPKRKWDEIK